MSWLPFIHMKFLNYKIYRCYIAEILLIRRKTLSNQSLKISKVYMHPFPKYTSHLELRYSIGFVCFVSCRFCFCFLCMFLFCDFHLFCLCFFFTKLVIGAVGCLKNPHFSVPLVSVFRGGGASGKVFISRFKCVNVVNSYNISHKKTTGMATQRFVSFSKNCLN